MHEVWISYTFFSLDSVDANWSYLLVGFTGSGQTMRKDPTRTRHVYQHTDDDGY